ncbi:MAG: hypothetical protein ACREJO_17345 [Phycisphaerales bacterium]
MSSTLPIKVIGPCLALAAFSTAMVVGLSADNPADIILSRALVAMLGGYAVGSAIALVVNRIVSDELTRRAAPPRNPAPTAEPQPASAGT